MSQTNYKPHFEHLKKKWTEKHRLINQRLWGKHKESLDWLHNSTKHAAVGSMAGVMMLAHPASASIIADTMQPDKNSLPVEEKPAHTKSQLMADLASLLPEYVQELSTEQKQSIGDLLTDYFNMTVTPVLEGKRLNRSYGYIGAEQHLMRYPGDTIASHFTKETDAQLYSSSGMAPGRGAWGWFAQSREEMSEKDIQREMYYIAVQTFLAPGWSENVNEYYNFFKYRKMLVVNPENGKAIVVVIGDAGPAKFTGKQLGGSPEVMKYLERVDGGSKGPVLYFFIDDPNDTIPLGPINVH